MQSCIGVRLMTCSSLDSVCNMVWVFWVCRFWRCISLSVITCGGHKCCHTIGVTHFFFFFFFFTTDQNSDLHFVLHYVNQSGCVVGLLIWVCCFVNQKKTHNYLMKLGFFKTPPPPPPHHPPFLSFSYQPHSYNTHDYMKIANCLNCWVLGDATYLWCRISL